MKLDNGKEVIFSPQEYSHFQLGYATTVHKSQGMTVDEAHILATPHFDRHTSYVALSRHKHAVKLYASKNDFKTSARLQQALGRDGEKLSTLDFTDARQPRHAPEHEVPASFLQRIWQSIGLGKGQGDTPEKAAHELSSDSWLDKDIGDSISAREDERSTNVRLLDRQEPQPDNTRRLER